MGLEKRAENYFQMTSEKERFNSIFKNAVRC